MSPPHRRFKTLCYEILHTPDHWPESAQNPSRSAGAGPAPGPDRAAEPRIGAILLPEIPKIAPDRPRSQETFKNQARRDILRVDLRLTPRKSRHSVRRDG